MYKPSSRENQGISLKERVSTSLRGVDLNWLGNSLLSDESFEKYETKAHINRALLWFASKYDDYVREDLKGGVLYSLLGQLTDSTNLSEWEEQIKSRFNAEFSQDLEIVLLKLSADKTYKKLYIQMIIRDVIENKTIPVSTEASL